MAWKKEAWVLIVGLVFFPRVFCVSSLGPLHEEKHERSDTWTLSRRNVRDSACHTLVRPTGNFPASNLYELPLRFG